MQAADLGTVLATVRERITRHRPAGIGEQDTKAALIVPVLRALGWEVEDLEEVRLEYRRRSSDNPVDYALFLLRSPRLFIEAKALGARLDDGKWASQILSYATVAGVEWVALTDGDEWRVYNSHATVPVEQKLFRAVRVSDPSSAAEETLRLLAKTQMADHLIDALWKSDFVDRQVRDALGRLFATEPDPSLVRLLRSKVPALVPSEIRTSLGRLRLAFDFPVVVSTPVVESAATRPAGAATKPPRRVAAPRPIAVAPTADGTPWRHVTLGQLVDAGLVHLPLALEHRYKGTDLVARVETVDRIACGGQVYESLSFAGGMARQSVVGSPPGRDYPQTNGWTFWQYRRPDGSLGYIDELRRELHEGKVVSMDRGRRAGT